MQQPSSVPSFQGDESPQDAEKWLKILVDSTGSFSDSGLFRLVTTRFPSGSPAREWFDNLDIFKEKWVAFEQQFRSRWIAESHPDGALSQDVGWNSFTNHSLNIDEYFSENTTCYDDLDTAVAIWVEEHIRLGKATGRDDTTLITATHPLLPPFISAYLRVHFKPPYGNFGSYCTKICEMPVNFLDLERIRRQISPVDRISSIERKVDGISDQVNHLVVAKCTCGMIGSGSATVPREKPPGVIMPLPRFVTSQMVGGQNSGSPFSDQDLIPDPDVESIATIRMGLSNEFLDYIEYSFSDGRRSERHGSTIQHPVIVEERFQLEESEYIDNVLVWAGSFINAIQFRTTEERLSPKFGNCGGYPIVLTAPPKHKLVCFTGRSGWMVDSLAAVWHRI